MVKSIRPINYIMMKIYCAFRKQIILLFIFFLLAVLKPETLASVGPASANDKSGSVAGITGWMIWSNDNLLTAAYSTDVIREVNKPIRLEFPDLESRGYHDWSFQSEERLDVEPGQVWTASAWVKYENTVRSGIDILAVSGGDTIPGWGNGSGWTSGMAWYTAQATGSFLRQQPLCHPGQIRSMYDLPAPEELKYGLMMSGFIKEKHNKKGLPARRLKDGPTVWKG
jgi:hypothetical protein